jgi:hypothetical protein
LVEIEVCWLFHDHPRAASVLVLLVSNLVNVADLGQGRSSRRNLLSLTDNLLGIGLDLLFLLFDNLGQLRHSALERLLYLFDSGFSSHFDLLVDFFGGFRRHGHLGVLGLLLDLFGFVFEPAEGAAHGGDLGTDGSDFRLLLIKNGSSSTDSLFNQCSSVANYSDILFNMGLLFTGLRVDNFVLEIGDHFIVVRDRLLQITDVANGLLDSGVDDGQLFVGFLGLLGHSFLGLLIRVSLSNCIFFDANGFLGVGVVSIFSVDSVNASSLDLLCFLLGVVRGGLQLCVGAVVSLPGGFNIGECGLDRRH